MPNNALGFFRSSKARRERAAQRSDNSIESLATFSVAGYGVHSSKIIAMSESSVFWICIDTSGDKIGRANVWTPVTNAHLVCRLLLEKKPNTTQQPVNHTS